MATIYDIARKAGVSTNTVSRALNNHSNVKISTKVKIKEIANELGYQPNAQAKSLATKKSWSIGILLVDDHDDGLKHTLFANIIDSILNTASVRGYDITFLSGNLGKNSLDYLEHSKYRMFDGVIVANTDFTDPRVVSLVNGTENIAFIDQEFEDKICVNSNNDDGIKKSVEFLHNLGHKEITYIHGQINNYVTEKRIEAFTNVTKQIGLEGSVKLIEGEYTSPKVAYDITKELIEKNLLGDAIMYSDDYSASGGLRCLLEHGINVPEDISIMGYDGVEISKLVTPNLTTIYQDVDKIGEVVTNSLIDQIEGETIDDKVIELPVQLVIGETTIDKKINN